MRVAGTTRSRVANDAFAKVADESSLVNLGERDHIERNRAAWECWAPRYEAVARKAWQEPLGWGIWKLPESRARLLEGIKPHADVIELGCGTAAISGWLARMGLKPIGVDLVRAQLETAAQLEREFGVSFGLLCANAEKLHFDTASFDVAISEYGASLWCDPRLWLREAHRLLRPNGRLIFITNSPLLMACTPEDGGPARDQLVRDYFSNYRMEFPGDGAIEFHPTHGEWVQLQRATGFELDRLIEVQAPSTASGDFDFATPEWAKRWPSEDIWVLRKSS